MIPVRIANLVQKEGLMKLKTANRIAILKQISGIRCPICEERLKFVVRSDDEPEKDALFCWNCKLRVGIELDVVTPPIPRFNEV